MNCENVVNPSTVALQKKLPAAGPRCVKEILNESQAKLLSEEKMLVDVSKETQKFKEQAAVKRKSTFRTSFKNASMQMEQNKIIGQPLVGQRKRSRFVSLKSEIHRSSIF